MRACSAAIVCCGMAALAAVTRSLREARTVDSRTDTASLLRACKAARMCCCAAPVLCSPCHTAAKGVARVLGVLPDGHSHLTAALEASAATGMHDVMVDLLTMLVLLMREREKSIPVLVRLGLGSILLRCTALTARRPLDQHAVPLLHAIAVTARSDPSFGKCTAQDAGGPILFLCSALLVGPCASKVCIAALDALVALGHDPAALAVIHSAGAFSRIVQQLDSGELGAGSDALQPALGLVGMLAESSKESDGKMLSAAKTMLRLLGLWGAQTSR